MYGTIARMQVKEGHLDELTTLTESWEEERGGEVEGAAASYVYQMDADPNIVMMAVVFADKKTYMANADDPAQDAWYQKMRACLAEDPEWHDGEIIRSFHAD